MIETHAFELNRKKYFQILALNRFRKYWWLYLIMILIAIFYLPRFGESFFTRFIVVFPFLYPFIIVLRLYLWAYSKKNANYFKKHAYSFDQENLYTKIDDGPEGQLPFSSIIDYRNFKDYMLIYISKGQFIYIPKNIFLQKADLQKFTDLVVDSVHQ